MSIHCFFTLQSKRLFNRLLRQIPIDGSLIEERHSHDRPKANVIGPRVKKPPQVGSNDPKSGLSYRWKRKSKLAYAAVHVERSDRPRMREELLQTIHRPGPWPHFIQLGKDLLMPNTVSFSPVTRMPPARVRMSKTVAPTTEPIPILTNHLATIPSRGGIIGTVGIRGNIAKISSSKLGIFLGVL